MKQGRCHFDNMMTSWVGILEATVDSPFSMHILKKSLT
jgi:hypothetical protein